MQIQTDQEDAYVLCGVTTKHMLTSNDNVVLITFHTDYTINKAGFNMTYHAITGDANSQGSKFNQSSLSMMVH